MSKSNWMEKAVRAADARFAAEGVCLTIGGEPSYVPSDASGAEWTFSAVGPTKLRYAYSLAEELTKVVLPGALTILSPGKSYPGEVNPRWVIHLLSNCNGTRLMKKLRLGREPNVAKLKDEIRKRLKLPNRWLSLASDNAGIVWALPLDLDPRKGWITERWKLSRAKMRLVDAEGPAGLRLPLHSLPEGSLKRALVLEIRDSKVHVFLPPLVQKGFLALLKVIGEAFAAGECGEPIYEGYIPEDESNRWSKLSITPDPGVLEINLPPCENAQEYGAWLLALEKCAERVGLRSFKQTPRGEIQGTGGGNHLLFGGRNDKTNPLFRRPAWVAAILRYWQRHPALSYLFSGSCVGPASQAPRPDESARQLHDLEMAYAFLEQLPPGEDHRQIIGETLRHLHIDLSGNCHRSEISFDKFWDVSWSGGCRGLIEFRALETLPHATWMAALAALWTALAAMLIRKRETGALVEFGRQLHDRYFLPAFLWADLEEILNDLSSEGFHLDREVFRAIWDYRFPVVLNGADELKGLVVRRALEAWPLLCETAQEGGSTGRFVDTSMERIEFVADPAFAKANRIFAHGREVQLQLFPEDKMGAALRYRRTALHPSLHPGIPVHLPLRLTITNRRGRPLAAYHLEIDAATFEQTELDPFHPSSPCRKSYPDLLTYDLRLQ